MEVLAVGLFLSIANQKIIDYLAGPVRKRWPSLDLWWLVYVALITGAAITWFAEINLFAQYVPDGLAGRILTCVAVGGGSSLLHDIFDS